MLRAEGRETGRQGNAAATVPPDSDGSTFNMVADVTISGKVAQFGRGILADVSARLMGQLVDCFQEDLAASGEETIHTSTTGAGPTKYGLAAVEPAPAPPVDLVATAGVAVGKRAAPIIALLFLAYWMCRRRRKRT